MPHLPGDNQAQNIMAFSNSLPRPHIGHHLFVLNHPVEYDYWRSLLQDYIFYRAKIPNIDAMTPACSLDSDYFINYKGHGAPSPDIGKAAIKADETHGGPFQSPDFANKCFDHAITTGAGFKLWVYETYRYVRTFLSPKLHEQTDGVRRGDLISLFEAIRISIRKPSSLSSDDLVLEYSRCRMAKEGKNDFMTYMSYVSIFIQKMEAVNASPNDSYKNAVLLRGLDQDIFDSFIYNHPPSANSSYV